jgi:hypothetical protein
MDGNRDQDITPERIAYLVNKWKDVLDYSDPKSLSAYKTTAILIEGQERWFTPKEVKASTPPNLKHEDQ